MRSYGAISLYDGMEFSFKLGPFRLKYDLNYPQVVREWKMDQPLHITETGVIATPLTRDKEFVRQWLHATFDRFDFAESICIWDETVFPYSLDAVQSYLKGG